MFRYCPFCSICGSVRISDDSVCVMLVFDTEMHATHSLTVQVAYHAGLWEYSFPSLELSLLTSVPGNHFTTHYIIDILQEDLDIHPDRLCFHHPQEIPYTNPGIYYLGKSPCCELSVTAHGLVGDWLTGYRPVNICWVFVDLLVLQLCYWLNLGEPTEILYMH